MKEERIHLAYTLCFLTRGSQVLMLHRRNSPNQGLWNGVGGRIEPGEAPLACILREVREETGYYLQMARYGGIVTWRGFEMPTGSTEPGGLYLFHAEAPAGEPAECSEGELAWRSLDWVFSSPDVVTNIHLFLPHLLAHHSPQEYAFNYQNGKISTFAFNSLPKWADITKNWIG